MKAIHGPAAASTGSRLEEGFPPRLVVAGSRCGKSIVRIRGRCLSACDAMMARSVRPWACAAQRSARIHHRGAPGMPCLSRMSQGGGAVAKGTPFHGARQPPRGLAPPAALAAARQGNGSNGRPIYGIPETRW